MTGPPTSSAGRPTRSTVPVLEVGGTHVTSANVDTATWGLVSVATRLPLVSSGRAETILDTLVEAADAVAAAPGSHWGVAMPDPFDYVNGIALGLPATGAGDINGLALGIVGVGAAGRMRGIGISPIGLGAGEELPLAVKGAIRYLQGAMAAAYPVGSGDGHGPVDHFYQWKITHE